jgi:hypothetical protein
MNVKRQTLPTKTPCNSTNWSHNLSKHFPKPSYTFSADRSHSPAPHIRSILVKRYRGYTGRNPKTAEKVKVAVKKLPFFKVGKELKDRVDEI